VQVVPDGDSAAPLSAVLSAARSGSTWVGALVDTTASVVYRFEPFHREWSGRPELDVVSARIADGAATMADHRRLATVLRSGSLEVDKPPFFPKQWRSRAGHGLWAAARALPIRPMRAVYEKLMSPPADAPVVFKEVDFGHFVEPLLTRMAVPVVYLVRHPCGVVVSNHRGQRLGLMPTERQHAMRSHLVELGADSLLDEFDERLDTMSDLEATAVLWRHEVERAVEGLDRSGDGHLVIYEQLCDDPETITAGLLGYLKLAPTAATERFLANGQGGPGMLRRDSRDEYFTVYRDPATQRDRWMNEITPAQRQAIERIVHPSPVFERIQALAGWA